jgi:hypothetical protein
MYYETFGQIKKMIGQLDTWLDAAERFAKQREIEPDTMLDYRLAPDQFQFGRQVRVACDMPKSAAELFTGKEGPDLPFEKTFEDLHVRARSVYKYLDGLAAEDFANAGGRLVSFSRDDSMVMTGEDFFIEHTVPNFYFHLDHAYAILRHVGVPLGKSDYLGNLTFRRVTTRFRQS